MRRLVRPRLVRREKEDLEKINPYHYKMTCEEALRKLMPSF